MQWKNLAQKVMSARIGNIMLVDVAVFLAVSAFIFRGVLSGLVFVGDLAFPLYPERLLEATRFAVYGHFNLGVNNILGWVMRTPYVYSVYVLYELTRNFYTFSPVSGKLSFLYTCFCLILRLKIDLRSLLAAYGSS
jgi:hypothetical protein